MYLTDENYLTEIENCFLKNQTVICLISDNPKCENCVKMRFHIEELCKIEPENDLQFFYVDYVKYDILQNYHQLNNLNVYPKSIVFYGSWDKKEFFEGAIPVKTLLEINRKSKS